MTQDTPELSAALQDEWRYMSINNVVFTEGAGFPFQLAQDEKVLYKSPTTRQPLAIKSKAAFGKTNIQCDDGRVYVTNKRFVYVTDAQGDINAFSIDLNLAGLLQFSHEIKLPWFGANYWQFLFFSAKEPAIASDGFAKEMWYEGTLQFNNGGLFEFIEVLNKVITDIHQNRDIDDELPRYSA